MSYSNYASPVNNASATTEYRGSAPKNQYGGIGRLLFFIISAGLYCAYETSVKAIIFGAFGSSESLGINLIAIMLIWVAVSFVVGMSRLQNQGCDSPLVMMLIGWLPILNLYIAWRLLACQEGFADEGQLDGIGKLLSLAYVGLIGLGIYGVVAG